MSYTALGGEGHILKTYGYDHFLRPASITMTDSEREATAEEYTYAYDKNGQIVTETRLNNYPSKDDEKVDESWAYTYDALGRLAATTVTDNATGSVKTQKSYTYDKAGNRLSETENGQTTTNSYNGLNQMVASGNSSYTYDANGNLTKETAGSGQVNTYSYDADNRLDTAVLTKNGMETLNQKNAYNGEGQRISKTENDAATRYRYQGGSVVCTDGDDSVRAMNILGEAGNIIASERNQEAAKAYYFYNKDMRGSTTSILDGTGACAAAYQYSDFGETTVNSEFYNEIAYTGGIWDKGTGLYYLNARYYDPGDGRFLTEDTYRGNAEEPGSLHLYAYCANNPVNYVDPSGHGYWGFYSKNQGYFAFNQNAPQKYFEYYDVYDFVVSMFGIKIKDFTVVAGKWKLVLWKGQYGKMRLPSLYGPISTDFSNGCEIGLYYKSGFLWKCAYQKSRRLRMRMSLYIGGTKLFTRDSSTSTVQGKSWWLNAFQPSVFLPQGHSVAANKLRMTGTIWFDSNSYSKSMEKLSKAFYDKAKRDKKMTISGQKNKWKTRKFSWNG